jgi:cysteinyl-tRNA synthetase
MNLTDVDDKTIKGSMQQGISLNEYTKKYKDAFFEDIKTLNIEKAETYPEATKHIKEMIEIIQVLMQKGYAYKGDDNSIYYSIKKFKDYGKLAHIKVDELQAGARVKQDEYEKENASDFALWKAWDTQDGDVQWESPFGKGRPGWHIECSAMSMKYLGTTFDMHTGGVDNIFPHHEDEIAQSEAATGKKFVNYWMHCEHLLVDGKKMSKSLGNFYTLRDLLDMGLKPKAIRYTLLSSHYRQQLNFSTETVKSSEKIIQRFTDFLTKLKEIDSGNENEEVTKEILKVTEGFEEAMDDDLNISKALSFVFEFMNTINKLMSENKIGKKNAQEAYDTMMDFDAVLGVMEQEKQTLDQEIDALIEQREQARKTKDFKMADKIRDDLKARGIILEDTPKGVRWKKA